MLARRRLGAPHAMSLLRHGEVVSGGREEWKEYKGARRGARRRVLDAPDVALRVDWQSGILANSWKVGISFEEAAQPLCEVVVAVV